MQEPNNNLKEHPDLYKRSIKGGYWVFAIRFVMQLLGFVKSIIVFNFLFKKNLELIIVANLLMAVLTTFSESGFGAALVQKKENIEDYLDTAWVIGILRGILLFVVIYFAAPLFASFKVDPGKNPTGDFRHSCNGRLLFDSGVSKYRSCVFPERAAIP